PAGGFLAAGRFRSSLRCGPEFDLPGSVTVSSWRARLWWVVPLGIVVALFGLRAVLRVDPRTNLAPSAAMPGRPGGTRAGSGSIYVARGGPLIVGFQSDGPARLTVGQGGSAREIAGQGVRTERIIVPAGPLAIRFAGAPDARLVWSPVGRRGDPEYLP